MKKALNNAFYILSFLLLISCSSLQEQNHISVPIEKMDTIQLGQTKSDISKALGKPTNKDIVEFPYITIESWNYSNNDKLKSQRAEISFDIKSNVVVAKTIIPLEGEPEVQLNFLLNNKFRAFSFTEIPTPRCHLDYFPSDSTYIDNIHGLLIKYDRNSQLVSAIIWMSPKDCQAYIDRIKNCIQSDDTIKKIE